MKEFEVPVNSGLTQVVSIVEMQEKSGWYGTRCALVMNQVEQVFPAIYKYLLSITFRTGSNCPVGYGLVDIHQVGYRLEG